MRVTELSVRDFRNLRHAELSIDPAATIVCGSNGAGKTNLIEALYFGLTGRSFRVTGERQVVHFEAALARAVVKTVDDFGSPHQIEVALGYQEGKRIKVDGARCEAAGASEVRPSVIVFHPDRLQLLKGRPALRRAHLDRYAGALWPGSVQAQRRYQNALSQRNALLARPGEPDRGELDPWDSELARWGVELIRLRREATQSLQPSLASVGRDLGVGSDLSASYEPCSEASTADELQAELARRHGVDSSRGFTGFGPHRDELSFSCDGTDLRAYGSQGQKRMAVLALLFSERQALKRERGQLPLMLLDDAMSELDQDRRTALCDLFAQEGQSLVTATSTEELDSRWHDLSVVWVRDGRVVAPTAAKARG